MVEHGNRGVCSERGRGKKLFEFFRCDGARSNAQKLAVLSNHPAGDDYFRRPGHAAKYQFNLGLRRLQTGFEILEIGAVGNHDAWDGPGSERRLAAPSRQQS